MLNIILLWTQEELNEEGNPYLALADTWDFKSMSTVDKIPGWLMENYGKGEGVKDIGFYGRFDISSDSYDMTDKY